MTSVVCPDETWTTSVASWQVDRWTYPVDLWTAKEGRSDPVPGVDVVEREVGHRSRAHLVYVL